MSLNSSFIKIIIKDRISLIPISAILLVFACLFPNTTEAQKTLPIYLGQWNQRVESDLQITIPMYFIQQDLREQLNNGTEQVLVSSNNLCNDNYSYKHVIRFTKPGLQTIGPYRFEYSGKKYVTDSIIVNVLESLPYEENIWIRVVESGDEKILIVEQMIKAQPSTIDSSDEFTMISEGGLSNLGQFAKLKTDTIEGKYFELGHRSSGLRVRVNPGALDPAYIYSYSKYYTWTDDNFPGTIKITKEDFVNWPNHIVFEPIEIDLRSISTEEYLKEWSKKLKKKQKKSAPK